MLCDSRPRMSWSGDSLTGELSHVGPRVIARYRYACNAVPPAQALARQPSRGWRERLQRAGSFLENSTGRGHHAEWVNSITLSHALTKRLDAYVEFFSAVTAERHQPWVGTFDVGFTFALTDDIQLDCGANFGLTRSADDVAPFVGITWRF